MRDFFKGWRRKVGCIALVMACGAMGGWLRSFLVCDLIRFEYDIRVNELFESKQGSLVWSENDEEIEMKWPLAWDSINVSETRHPFDDPALNWQWRYWGFGIAKYPMMQGYIIPYWSIVIPLTLLSACLILWKPRQTPKPATGSVADA